ncbi:hypothetical protein LguiA_010871 [Lonicera macranthoides]
MKQEYREKEMTHVMFKCMVRDGSSDIKFEDLNGIHSLTSIRISLGGSRHSRRKNKVFSS